jgi:CubicO group peptidase (beta-lactamase class C family)
MVRNSLKLMAITILLALSYAIYKYYPQLEVLNGYAARTACSCTFMIGRPLDVILSEDLAMSPLNWATVKIDTSAKSSTASVFGLSPKTAVYRNGLGCILLEGKDDYHVNFNIPEHRDSVNYSFIQSKTSTINDAEISKLEQLAFDEGKAISHKKTRALLVLHRDTLIIESYAKGINKTTKLLGWSMTKSVLNAMIGVLSKQNKISIHDKALFPQWIDRRKEIEINDLLHMNSGLEWTEDYSTVSEATSMLFASGDMPQYVSSIKMKSLAWVYSSGSSNLLSGIVRSKFKAIEEYHSFPYKYIFEPLGMDHSLIETDEAGNYITSSYMYGRARDWLRFGRLYLHDGVWQGNRILPENWVNYTCQEVPGSDGKYGAHFWLNKRSVAFPDCPQDIFYADGYQGQYIVIVPSHDLVIVRMGLDDIDMNQLIKTTIDAIKN